MTAFQHDILTAIKALGEDATWENVAARLRRKLKKSKAINGPVKSGIWQFWRDGIVNQDAKTLAWKIVDGR